MYINDSDLDVKHDLDRAIDLIKEFVTMDAKARSQVPGGFIKSIIEPFLGRKEYFNTVLKQFN